MQTCIKTNGWIKTSIDCSLFSIFLYLCFLMMLLSRSAGLSLRRDLNTFTGCWPPYWLYVCKSEALIVSVFFCPPIPPFASSSISPPASSSTCFLLLLHSRHLIPQDLTLHSLLPPSFLSSSSPNLFIYQMFVDWDAVPLVAVATLRRLMEGKVQRRAEGTDAPSKR